MAYFRYGPWKWDTLFAGIVHGVVVQITADMDSFGSTRFARAPEINIFQKIANLIEPRGI